MKKSRKEERTERSTENDPRNAEENDDDDDATNHSGHGNDTIVRRALRFVGLAPPHPDEDPLQKKIRILTWCSLGFDFLTALAFLIGSGGSTTQCCGQSVMSAILYINWDQAILIISFLYLFLVMTEMCLAMKVPLLHVVNPFIVFLLAFSVVLSEPSLSIFLYVFSALSVVCQAINCRFEALLWQKGQSQRNQTKNDLRAIQDKIQDQVERGKVSVNPANSVVQPVRTKKTKNQTGRRKQDDEDELYEERKSRHLTRSRVRTKRALRVSGLSQTKGRRKVIARCVSAGVNALLTIASWVLLLLLSSRGGWCVRDSGYENIVRNNPLERCDSCRGGTECQRCEVTDASEPIDADFQCYYPWI